MDEEKTEYVSVGKTFLLHRPFMSATTTCVWLEMQTYWWLNKKTKNRINPYVSCGQPELAYWTGVSESSVKKAIQELKILGFIDKIEHRFMNSCRYYLNTDPNITTENIEALKAFQKEYSNIRKKKKKSEKLDTLEDEYWGEKKIDFHS